jgi:hypothetical protein
MDYPADWQEEQQELFLLMSVSPHFSMLYVLSVNKDHQAFLEESKVIVEQRCCITSPPRIFVNPVTPRALWFAGAFKTWSRSGHAMPRLGTLRV